MDTLPRGRDGEWLDLVADLISSPLTVWPEDRVSRLLVDTFDAGGCVTHSHSDSDGLTFTTFHPVEHFIPYLDEAVHWTRHEAPLRHPLLRYHLSTGLGTCLQIEDVPSGIADRRMVNDWRARGRRWGGVQAQASIPVLWEPGGRRSFVIGRTDVYTAQEMALMRRLQRLLAGLDRQIGVFSSWSARTGPDAFDTAEAVRLTPRELAVLELLARSLTAAAIARKLGVAERTVHKHLQRVYTKLGAADRMGAVFRAQSIGLLPGVRPRNVRTSRPCRPEPSPQHAGRPTTTILRSDRADHDRYHHPDR
ncbi:LuxR family transcriptional regulator [Pseudonocardia sp. KRD291]|uniref:helix-turn-helix transcriptional regulator n=1 Tax=Pseudonocardia sp. KRD291 TaxID=2792007 RepID=UPI001C4A6F8B|nr:LuxR family transcriptional regulator [Pseudonocardia sp. KRD291]MBW0105765.1 hypothetical protein [Pseudonocardia sp. KRD291]